MAVDNGGVKKIKLVDNEERDPNVGSQHVKFVSCRVLVMAEVGEPRREKGEVLGKFTSSRSKTIV